MVLQLGLDALDVLVGAVVAGLELLNAVGRLFEEAEDALGLLGGGVKACNSEIRLVMSSPVSPMSLVLTRESAVSEKSLSFFWLAAPYCKTIWEFVMSIFSQSR